MKTNGVFYNWINRNFIIRVSKDTETKRSNKLYSAATYENLVGQKLAIKHFKELLNTKSQKTTKRLRRGLIIDFVSK